MYCNKCGNELKEDDVFCPKCGNKIRNKNENIKYEVKIEKTNSKLVKIVIAVGIIIVLIIGAAILLNNIQSAEEKDVIEIVNRLNSGNEVLGDWNGKLHIDKVMEVKKVDINRLNSKYREGANAQDTVYMMNLQEKNYGVIQVVIVNGKVTANSILGETYDDLWNSDSFTNDKFNLEKINQSIK